ncbi:cation transporter, partial [Pantoea septica]|uniref:cation transporter n=1 Tax=Pantoea septica TaxID=472695 RepID=UPI0028991004
MSDCCSNSKCGTTASGKNSPVKDMDVVNSDIPAKEGRPEHDAATECCSGTGCCASEAINPSARDAAGNDIQTRLRIMQMDCPTEETLIRKKLGPLSAVKHLEFNLMQRTLTVTHAARALEPVLEAVRSLGFDPQLTGEKSAGQKSSCSGSQPSGTTASCCTPSPVTFSELQTQQTTAEGVRTSIRIMQMDCPVEEGLIRKKLDGMPEVKELDFNLMQRVLTVVHTPDALDPVLVAIRSLGFEPELPDSSGQHAVKEEKKKSWWPLALAGAAAIAAEAMHWVGMPEWVEAALALIAVSACGLTTYKKGWIALRNGNLNINALMSIAVTGALALGQWPEAAMVMVLFTIAELIEAKSLDRAL